MTRNNTTLRIFATASSIASVYMAAYASETSKEHYEDHLFLDVTPLKPSQQQLITAAATLHRFEKVHNFSTTKPEFDSPIPPKSKQLTRKLKAKPIFKQIYDFLYQFKLAQRKREISRIVADKSEIDFDVYDRIELYSQPLLNLNQSLIALFPKAPVHFIEHGIGDYFDITKSIETDQLFHCLFHKSYVEHLDRRGIDSSFVADTFSPKTFITLSNRFKDIFPQITNLQFLNEDKVALLLMQSFEEYGADPAFWPHFIDDCLEQIPANENFLFVIKPHQRQSAESLRLVLDHLEAKNLTYQVLDTPEIQSLAMEVVFAEMSTRVKWVFSPYSSSVYYLAALYENTNIEFFYGLTRLHDFADNCSDFYKKRWRAIDDAAGEIFGPKVKEL